MDSTNIFLEVKKRQALKELVFDSIDMRLESLICRIDLRKVGGREVCVIVFSHPLALQEWKMEKARTLEKMRELYKQRGLKKMLVFYQVLVEVVFSYSPNKEIKESKQIYKERSSGEFEIKVQDTTLRSIFKSIQAAIKQNLKKESQCKN